MQKKAVIIQDISCFGKCSATVALPIVSAFGVECALLPTALLSAHTGFPVYSCFDLTGEMKTVVADWKKLSLSFDGFFSGYMLSDGQASLALDVLSLVKSGGLILVDPVLGDDGKPYAMLSTAFSKKMLELVSKADVITPNLTEAALLLGREPMLSGYDESFVEESLSALKKLGCRVPMITGVSFEKEKIGVAYLEDGKVSYAFSKKHDGVKSGTGDVLSSCLFGALMDGKSVGEAVRQAVDFTERAILCGADDYAIDFEGALCEGIQRTTNNR